MNGVDTVEQIFPKQSLLYHFRNIFIGSRDQPDINGNHFVTSDSVTFRFCSTVNSLACSAMERFPISSIKRELPLAASNFPGDFRMRR